MLTEDDDPSAFWGAVVTAAGAVLALLVAFGVQLTQTQTTAILAVLTAVGPLVTALLVRRKAWRPESVREAAARSLQAGQLPPDVARLGR